MDLYLKKVWFLQKELRILHKYDSLAETIWYNLCNYNVGGYVYEIK